jgi:hypothetical protein
VFNAISFKFVPSEYAATIAASPAVKPVPLTVLIVKLVTPTTADKSII